MGNGVANIIAALIVAAAILFNGGAFNAKKPGQPASAQATEADFARWYARAVGDIRNDIVVNCGCCGDGEARPKETRESF